MSENKYEIHHLGEAGWCPNNPKCPVIVYRATHTGEPENLAQSYEKRFSQNAWPPAWRYTIYDYPHYHSTTHEVIGVYRGWASVRLGGSDGIVARLQPGDAVVIPAGVSHQRIDGSEDFAAVGAYPKGCEPDQMRGTQGERPTADERILRLPKPESDPLEGDDGPLSREWPNTPGD